MFRHCPALSPDSVELNCGDYGMSRVLCNGVRRLPIVSLDALFTAAIDYWCTNSNVKRRLKTVYRVLSQQETGVSAMAEEEHMEHCKICGRTLAYVVRCSGCMP